MLKNLKKDGKKEPKEKVAEKKQPKAETKKQAKEDEEEEVNVDLVDINYQQKETATAKPSKKVQTASKLEEKIIDTSTIVIEKKEEKKPITSWVVNEADVKSLVANKIFKMEDHDTEFESLTNTAINEELKEKAKKDLIENKPKIKEEGGVKFAPLEPSANEPKGNRDQELVLNRKVENSIMTSNLPIKEVVFTNSATADIKFKALEKTAQQLKEEQLEAKIKNKEPELVMKGKGSWLGGVKKEEVKPAEFKVSAWAAKADQIEIVGGTKFAPLQKSGQEQKVEKVASRRQEQEFVFVSKKDMDERRKVREELDKKKVETPVQK